MSFMSLYFDRTSLKIQMYIEPGPQFMHKSPYLTSRRTLFSLAHVCDALLSWNLGINAVIPPFTIAPLVLKQEFGGVE